MSTPGAILDKRNIMGLLNSRRGRRRKGERGGERGREKRRRRNGSYFFPRNATIWFLVFHVVLSGMTGFSRGERLYFTIKSSLNLCY